MIGRKLRPLGRTIPIKQIVLQEFESCGRETSKETGTAQEGGYRTSASGTDSAESVRADDFQAA